MRALLNIILKELIQLKRDPKIVPILFVAPVFQLMVLGYAATTDIHLVEMAVCDLDQTAESRTLVDAFTSSKYFRVVTRVDSQDHIDAYIENGAAKIALTIPKGFAADRASGRAGTVQLVTDGSDATTGRAGLGYANTVLANFSRSSGIKPLIELRPVVLYNPDLVSRNFMVPATLAMILMVMTMMLTAMALVRESEIGTMEQLLVTPIKAGHLITGKLFAYSLVGAIEFFSALPIVLFWFKVPLRGRLLDLILLTFPFLLCTLSLGILVSTLAQTQQQAMMLTAFLFMMPQIYLSGFTFPIQNMPEIFQYITYIIPLRYYVIILRGVFLKGVGWDVLWPQAAALVALGTSILLIARFRFRQRLV